MNPGRMTTRTGLIEMLYPLVPSRACQKAIEAGRIRVIGGFRDIPPFSLPGWICCVRSVHGRTWLLALCVDEISHKYLCHLPDEIPWSMWVGKANGDDWNAYNGDDPHVSACNSGCTCDRDLAMDDNGRGEGDTE